MTVTCIDDDGANLTDGNQYEVQKEDDEYVWVINDVDRLTWYSWSRFQAV